MTLAYLQSLVGPPPVRAETYRRINGELLEWGWRDTIVDGRGWWYAVTSGGRVLAIGWTSGGASQRNAEIKRAIRDHMQPAVPEAIA